MKKSNVMPTVVLTSICIVVALLLSVVNIITAPIIEANKAAAASGAFAEILPGATGQQDLTIDETYPSVVTAGYKFDNGYVFQMEVTGYSPGLIILCGIDTEGKVTGMKHIQTGETYGFESQLNSAYIGKDIDTAELIIASGATPKSLTSKAYFEAVTAALQSYIIASGGTVDLRSPEDIKCNDALGTETLTFSKWFALEKFDGIDKVYVANEDSARVYVFGETYVGVKGGAVITAGVSEENKSAALAADAAINSITLTNVDKPEGTKNYVVNIQAASNGAYVFELLADGYQAIFDYGNGTQISIKLSIDADGKIIDVLTLSHAESAGIGDACATEEYYEQYRGQGSANIVESAKYPTDHHDDLISPDNTDIGAIASATYTTVGYQKAVKAAFAAFELLTAEEGGNQ